MISKQWIICIPGLYESSLAVGLNSTFECWRMIPRIWLHTALDSSILHFLYLRREQIFFHDMATRPFHNAQITFQHSSGGAARRQSADWHSQMVLHTRSGVYHVAFSGGWAKYSVFFFFVVVFGFPFPPPPGRVVSSKIRSFHTSISSFRDNPY
jgi:hypothetical protein